MNEPNTLPVVRQTTGLALNEGPNILGERRAQIPTSGKVRPGIKVLTAAAANNPKAKEAYQSGVDAGKNYTEIERAIRQACGMKDSDRSPLTPRNVAYFTVRRADFAMPEIADRIMDLYAEDRGEGRHLYRFPVVFPVDSWQAVLPHSLKVWKRRELKYWSEYGSDGVRYCKMPAPMVIDERTKRARRPWGGRGAVLRPEHEGRCEPEQCPEYQKGDCKLSGSLIFYIPGIPGASAIAMSTTSFYSMQGIRRELELMMYVRGRISGKVNGQPMFWLTKRQEEVSMLDLEKGEPKRVKQWITVLEANVDMTNLLTAAEEDTDQTDAIEGATRVLEGPDDDEPADAEIVDAALPNDDLNEAEPTVEELQAEIKARVTVLSVLWADLTPYLDERYGEWKTDRQKLGRVLDELNAVDDPKAFHNMVTTGAPF